LGDGFAKGRDGAILMAWRGDFGKIFGKKGNGLSAGR